MTLHPDMTEAEYRALPGLSGTQLKTLLESPAKYKRSLTEPWKTSESQAFGTVVHALVLGSDMGIEWWGQWATLTGTAAQAWADDCAARQVIPALEAWRERVDGCVAALRGHADAAAILWGEGATELAVTSEHEGVVLKGRIDKVWSGRVVDLKTISVRTGDGFEDACHKAIGSYGYHIQLTHYRHVMATAQDASHGDLAPLIVFVESDFPHRVAVIELSGEDCTQGFALCLEAYRRYMDCTEADVWPDGSPEGIKTSRIPTWAARQWDRVLTGA